MFSFFYFFIYLFYSFTPGSLEHDVNMAYGDPMLFVYIAMHW